MMFGFFSASINSQEVPGNVVLLHGLARTANSMASMARTLSDAGYTVCNIDYPSRYYDIKTLADTFVYPTVKQCFEAGPVNFVTHSLGGILVRHLATSQHALEIGRVVMLSPPNQGTEVVDKIGNWGIFEWINGPAGKQLGTDSNSVPNRLPSASFEVGIITGNRSINLILSWLIPGSDDGKVSIVNAKLSGMQDFIVVNQTHPFIMTSDLVQQQALHFLNHGRFDAIE